MSSPILIFLSFCLAIVLVSAVPVLPSVPSRSSSSSQHQLKNPNCTGSEECPVWPAQFSAPFGLYSFFPKITNASSMFYSKYTDTVQAQVVDYKTKCFPFASIGSLLFQNPCKFFFNPDGIYFTQPERGVRCCQFMKGVGAVPPNFLKAFNLADPEAQAPDLWDRSIKVERWEADGGFAYWTVAHGDAVYPEKMWGHDIAFQDGPTMVMWRWGMFNVTEQEDAIFKLPGTPEQCSQSCPWFDPAAAGHNKEEEEEEEEEEEGRAAVLATFPLHSLHARRTGLPPASASPASAPWRIGEGEEEEMVGGGRKCKAAGTEKVCEARGCQWCVSIDMEWCQAAGSPCKE